MRESAEGSATGALAAARPRTSWRVRRRWLTGYLFITPLLLLFATYHLYPILRSLEMSFTNFKYLAPADTRFVGLDNYAEALGDPHVGHGVLLAAEYLLMYIPVVMLLSVGVALLLDRVASHALAGVYRTIY